MSDTPATPTTPTVQLRFELPTRETPGYFRRYKRFVAVSAAWQREDRTPEDVDRMVEFFADFVVEPADRAAAVEALWDCTEAQFDQLTAAFTGKTGSQAAQSSAS